MSNIEGAASQGLHYLPLLLLTSYFSLIAGFLHGEAPN